MMMNSKSQRSSHPDLRKMLPSQLRKYVTDYLRKRINGAPVTHFGGNQTTFRLSEALSIFRGVPGLDGYYGAQIIHECYQTALDEIRLVQRVMDS